VLVGGATHPPLRYVGVAFFILLLFENHGARAVNVQFIPAQKSSETQSLPRLEPPPPTRERSLASEGS
jgi:hypothetical protein